MANGERKTDTLRESHEEREKQHKTGGKDYESHKKSEWKKINEHITAMYVEWIFFCSFVVVL